MGHFCINALFFIRNELTGLRSLLPVGVILCKNKQHDQDKHTNKQQNNT